MRIPKTVFGSKFVTSSRRESASGTLPQCPAEPIPFEKRTSIPSSARPTTMPASARETWPVPRIRVRSLVRGKRPCRGSQKCGRWPNWASFKGGCHRTNDPISTCCGPRGLAATTRRYSRPPRPTPLICSRGHPLLPLCGPRMPPPWRPRSIPTTIAYTWSSPTSRPCRIVGSSHPPPNGSFDGFFLTNLACRFTRPSAVMG